LNLINYIVCVLLISHFVTLQDDQQDSGMYPRSYLESRLRVALGGRVAEELRYGESEITTGASSDLQQVAGLARRMVTQWGFASDTLGATAWENPDQSGFGAPQMASEKTQQRIDSEVEAIVNAAYVDCKATLVANRPLLDEIVAILLKEETINTQQLNGLLETFKSRALVAAA
jgi:cell division protease FtsH